MKGIPEKLKKRFVGHFKVDQRIGKQAYELSLPDKWKMYPVFHISLLKNGILQVYKRKRETQKMMNLKLKSHTMKSRNSWDGERSKEEEEL